VINARGAVPPARLRRPGAVILGCAVGFLLGELFGALLLAAGADLAHYRGGVAALAKAATASWWASALSLAGLWIGFAVAIAYARAQGLRPSGQWRVRLGDLRYVLLGLAAQVGIGLLYAPFHPSRLNRPTHHLFDSLHGPTLVAVGVLTVIGAPLLEEWFFRGVLYRALRDLAAPIGRVLSVLVGAVVSGALFGLAHGEMLQFAGLALLGVVLALVVERTGRLVPAVVTHASFNAVALGVLLYQRSGR
jgi:membrane protease YdiL (CAAX protease family)